MSQVQPRGREGFKRKKPKNRKQSQTSPCLAGRPAPVDKRCPRASSATAGRPAPAPEHTEARTKHPQGSRGGAGPGRTGPGASRAPGHGEQGGRRTLRGLGHRHKMAAPFGSGSAPSPRPAASSALTHRATQPRPDTMARRSRCAPLVLPRDAEEPPHLKWRTPRLTPPRPPPLPLAPLQPSGSRRPTRSQAGRDCGAGPAPPRLHSATSGAPRGPHPADPCSAPGCRPQSLSPKPRSPPPAPICNCAMGANKGAAGLYSFTSPAGRSPGCGGGGSAEPGRGRPKPAAAPGLAGRSRRGRGQQGPVGTGDIGAGETRPARSGERVGDRERREKSGSGPWERRGRALSAGSASSRESPCEVLCRVLGSSARESSYWR